jgi:ferredoxin-NADP reductase
VFKEYFSPIHGGPAGEVVVDVSTPENSVANATVMARARVGLTNLVVGNQRARLDMQRRGSIFASKWQSTGNLLSVAAMAASVPRDRGVINVAAVHPDPWSPNKQGVELVSRSPDKNASPLQSENVIPASLLREAVRGENALGLATISYAASASSKSKVHLLLPGEHIELQALVNAEALERNYSPIPVAADDGTLQLLIKVYPKGAMSRFLSKCGEGDYVKLRGPLGSPVLNKIPGNFQGAWPHVFMLAGGSGITPMLGLIHYHLACNVRAEASGHKRSRMVLMQFDKLAEDIMARDELRALEKASDGFLEVHNILTASDDIAAATGAPSGVIKPVVPLGRFSGRINTTMVRTLLTEMDAASKANTKGDIIASPSASETPLAVVDCDSSRVEGKQTEPAFPYSAAVASSNSSLAVPHHVPHAGEPLHLTIQPRVFLCGPVDFMRAAVGSLDELGFNMQNLHVF